MEIAEYVQSLFALMDITEQQQRKRMLSKYGTGGLTMDELKPCEYCKEIPELQRGVEFASNLEKFRYHCPRCNIISKSCYTIEGAIEVWNRGTENA
jgi:hypothetical protein